MEQERLINQFKCLSPRDQRQVFDFITFLQGRYKSSKGRNGSAGILLKDEPFFGMWKDREEMAGSTSWVRNIRNTQITDL
jgi:hypothetical protein